MPRLLVIRLRYPGVSAVNAADAVGVSGQTDYNRQARRNAEEFDGLVPPYSPDLNPIEQVWRAIKREVAATFVRDYEHLTTTIATACENPATKRTYWEKWVKTFLGPKYAAKMLSQ